MSYIILPSRTTRQPSSFVRSSGPLAKGLLLAAHHFAKDSLATRNEITGQTGTAGGVVWTATPKGMVRTYAGTTGGSVPLNLSSNRQITITMSLWQDTYANDDKLALELTENFGSGGINAFVLDPNSSSPSGVFAVTTSRSGTFAQRSFTRPSAAAWHEYAFMFDRTGATAGTVIPSVYVDGVSQALTDRISGDMQSSDWTAGTLYLMCRNVSSLPLAGKLANLKIYNRLLTQGEAQELAFNPRAHLPEVRRLYFGAGAGGGPTTYNVSYTDSKTLTDLYNSLAVFNSPYSESKVLSDAYWGTGTLVGAYSESITLNDADTGDVGAATYSRDYEESLTLSDTYTSQLVGTAAQEEAITLSETYAGSSVFVAAVSESVTLSDTQEQDSAKLGSVTETISLSDAYSTQLVAVSSYSDTIDTQDLYSNQAVFSSEITDSSTLLDAYAATIPGGAGDGTLTEETIDLIADEVMRRLYENPVRRM